MLPDKLTRKYDNFKMLIHLSDKEYQWYCLGWSNQFIRYLTDIWKEIKENDILCLTSSNANIMRCKVTSIEKSKKIRDLIKNSNYINLYPNSQNYESTYYYIQDKLCRNSISEELKEHVDLGLFTIKII